MARQVEIDLNKKLRAERSLFVGMRRIFSDMAAQSVSPFFIPKSFNKDIESELNKHYTSVSEIFVGGSDMDHLQELMFLQDLKDKLRIRAAKQTKIIGDTNERQYKRVPSIIAKKQVKDRAAALKNAYLALLNSRTEIIATTETQWSAEFSKFLEFTYEIGEAGIITKAAAIPSKRWDAVGDDHMRDWHADADSQVQFGIDPFEVMGELLQFPGDTSLGATTENIAGCRCSAEYGPSKASLTKVRRKAKRKELAAKIGKGIVRRQIIKKITSSQLRTQVRALNIGATIAFNPLDEAFFILSTVNITDIQTKIAQLAAKARDKFQALKKAKELGPGKISIVDLDRKAGALKRARIRLTLAREQLVKDQLVHRQIAERLAIRNRMLASVRDILERPGTAGKLEDLSNILDDIDIPRFNPLSEENITKFLKFLDDPENRRQIKFVFSRKNTRNNVIRKALIGLEQLGVITPEIRKHMQFLMFHKKTPQVIIRKTMIALERLKIIPRDVRVEIQAILLQGPDVKNILRRGLAALENLDKISPDLRKQIQFILVTEKTPQNVIRKALLALDRLGKLDPEVRQQLRFLLTTKKDVRNIIKRTLLMFEKLDGINPDLRRQIQFLLFGSKRTTKDLERIIRAMKALSDEIPSIVNFVRRPIVVKKAKEAKEKIRKFKGRKFPGGPEETRTFTDKRFSKWLKKEFPEDEGFTSKQRNLIFQMRKISALEAEELIRGLEVLEDIALRPGIRESIAQRKAKIKKNIQKSIKKVFKGNKKPGDKGRGALLKKFGPNKIRTFNIGPLIGKKVSRVSHIELSGNKAGVAAVEALQEYKGGPVMARMLQLQRLRHGLEPKIDLGTEFDSLSLKLEKTMNKFMNKSVLETDTTLYRVVRDFDGDIQRNLDTLKVGDNVPVVAFQSTSFSKKFIDTFENQLIRAIAEEEIGIKDKSATIRFKINVPAGTKAIPIDDILKQQNIRSPFGVQDEIVLPNEGVMKVKKITDRAEGQPGLLPGTKFTEVEFDFIPETIFGKKQKIVGKEPITKAFKKEVDVPNIKVTVKDELIPLQTKPGTFTPVELDRMVEIKEGGGFITDTNRFRLLKAEGFGIEGAGGSVFDVEDFAGALKAEKDFDNIFVKARTKDDLILYRAVSDFEGFIQDAIGDLKPGDKMPMIGLQSSTSSLEYVNDFLEGLMSEPQFQGRGKGWIFEIKAPKGSHILDIDNVLKSEKISLEGIVLKEESEWLLPHKGHLIVRNIDEDNNIIEFDLVTKTTDFKSEDFVIEVKAEKTTFTVSSDAAARMAVTEDEFYLMLLAGGHDDIAARMLASVED